MGFMISQLQIAAMIPILLYATVLEGEDRVPIVESPDIFADNGIRTTDFGIQNSGSLTPHWCLHS
jgi:hypothetical protein